MFLIIVMYALVALSVTLSKLILENYTDFIFLTGSRMALGGAILLAYQYFSPHEHFKFRKKHIWLYAEVVFIGMYLANMSRFYALSQMPSSKLSFIYNLSPFFSALYEYFFFQERLTRRQWTGLLIGFIGFIPLLIYRSPEEMGLQEWMWISWPELLALIGVASHSYTWIAIRRLVKEENYSPVMVNGLSMLASGILALSTSALFFTTGFQKGPLVTNWLPFLGFLACIIVVSNILSHNMYGFLLKKYNPTFLSGAGFLAPIFNAFLGWVFLGESVTWHFFSSSAVVLGGLYLFYLDEKPKNRASSEPSVSEDL